jgi:phosphoglycerol transferase MdoB-like AlkP superfamily enzyme
VGGSSALHVSDHARSLRRAGVEILFWLCAPSLFLLAYVLAHGAPASAVLPHLRLVLLIWGTLALTRMAIACCVRSESRATAAAAGLTSLLLFVILLYYALVLVSMASWGRVITWHLLSSYATHAAALADTLGIPVVPVMIGIAVLYVALLAGTWRYFEKLEWTWALSRALSWRAATCVIAIGLVALAAEWHRYASDPPTDSAEPLSLTFFPLDAAASMRSRGFEQSRAAILDRLEDAARAEYQPVATAAERRNVVVIVVDSLRPDHMGVYGYGRDTTPFLSGLARDGLLRKAMEMRATCSTTLCGVTSLASSRYVHELPPHPFLLHDVLKLHGYRSEMILGGSHDNLKQFFHSADRYFEGPMARGAEPDDDRIVLERARALPTWDGVPVMLQFHLMSAHAIGTRYSEFRRYLAAENYALSYRDLPHAPESVANFYDNGVVQADAMIAQLLGILRPKGYLRNAVVAITADHGEALGEHGSFGHSNGLDDEVLRIPFMLVAEGYSAKPFADERAIASQVDVAPTLLAELGIPAPRSWSGVPLQRPNVRDAIFLQDRNSAGLVDTRDARRAWKYWADGRTGRQYAFDLSRDPRTRSNLLATVPPQLARDWRARYLEMVPEGMGAVVSHEE